MDGSQQQALSPNRMNLVVISILLLYTLVGMGIDLIAPSLPAISANLKASATLSKNIITMYLIGYTCGNFIIGFLSDALGRRNLLVYGLLVFAIISLMPIYFPHMATVLLARFLQGVSLSSFVVVGRAVFSDILPPDKLISKAVLIATMWGIGPIIGPVIGGYLQYYFGWQACFYFFSIFGFIGFILLFFVVPETHYHRQPLKFLQLLHNFRTIVTHRVFMSTVILMGTSYSLLIAFTTLGPFLIQTELGRSSIYYGHVALYLGFVFLIATIGCRYLTKYYLPDSIFSFVIPLFWVIALVGFIFSYFYSSNMFLIILLSLFMFFVTGLIYPAAMGKGLALFRHLAGSGAAVMSLVTMSITSLSAFVMSFVTASSLIPIALFYLGLMSLSGCVWLFLISRKRP